MATTVHTPLSVDRYTRIRSLPTPGWLRLVRTGLALAVVITGGVGITATLAREHAARVALATAEPLVVDAQMADVKLSDANTSIAGGFLAGPVVPAAAESRLNQDLAQAAAALTAAAQRGGSDQRVGALLTSLTVGLASYRSVLGIAEADNRQSFPVAAAYLAEANNLMRVSLLPAAESLYSVEESRLIHEDSRATESTWLVVLIILFAVVLVALLWTQVELARRFRRVINVGTVVATILVLVAAMWSILAATAADRAVSNAEHHGTTPLGVLTRARILAQQVRADDELTRLTTDPFGVYQKDFGATSRSLSALLSSSGPGWTLEEHVDLDNAGKAWTGYQQAHQAAAQNATRGDDSGEAQASAAFDGALGSGVTAAVGSFTEGAAAASDDMSDMGWALGVLIILAAAAIVVGLEPRIREYR